MGEVGILHEDDRVELLDGHLYVMSPIGSERAACVRRLTRLFIRQAEPHALVSVQNPIRLDRTSEPEPDLALLTPREDDYAARHPHPDEVLLVIEVADSSESFDRSTKRSLYARAGLPEYWVVALEDNQMHVYRTPEGDQYTAHEPHAPGDMVSIAALPSIDPIPLDDILGS